MTRQTQKSKPSTLEGFSREAESENEFISTFSILYS